GIDRRLDVRVRFSDLGNTGDPCPPQEVQSSLEHPGQDNQLLDGVGPPSLELDQRIAKGPRQLIRSETQRCRIAEGLPERSLEAADVGNDRYEFKSA
ncbi:hypothetical protein ACC735_38360, partial [Rhizobium ruizarguesonis]